MGKLPENTLILTAEPFVGFMPSDLRAWLTNHNSDADLACALAEVNDHAGLLGHELDEIEDRWLLYAYETWWEVELELYDLIFDSMKRSNQRGETEYNLTQEELYYCFKPFMERNGYRDGAGWWVKLEEELR